MSPFPFHAEKPGEMLLQQHRGRKRSIFKYIFFIELTLIFSIIASFFILMVVKGPKASADPITSPSNYRYLFQNYKVLSDFINLPIRTEPVQDPEFEISNPFIIDMLELKTAAVDLAEKGEKEAASIGNRILGLETRHQAHPHRHAFIRSKKNKLHLKYLYYLKNHQELIDHYNTNPDSFDTLELKLFVMDSYVKTRDTEKAFAMFRDLFGENPLKPFADMLPRQTLNTFLRQLDYDYWFNKFKYLARTNRYGEFNREKNNIRSPQLINLFNGEFSYQQRQYEQCRKYLRTVKEEKLLPYKERIIFKINIRENNYEADSLFEQLVPVQGDAEVYHEVLLDAASILLTDGQVDLAEKFFSRYLSFTRLLQYVRVIHAGLANIESLPRKGPDYWRVLWICAWLNYQKNDKAAAVGYFKEGIDSPIFAYRVANRYWLQRLNKNSSPLLELEKYPFTYYYTRNKRPRNFRRDRESLKPFIELLNHEQSSYFRRIIADLKDLVHYNLLEEAGDFIQWAIGEEELTVSDKHTLMLIESILYLRQKNYAMAFIRFRDNFQCYQCVRLPRFLSQVALPVKYAELIDQYSELHKVDRELIYSVIREESFFRPDAVSSANACGLMQLLLKTAREVAYRYRIKVYRRDLFQPELNIRLGVEYLKYLIDKYDGKLHLALAAYNAGDHRVDEWLQRIGNAPDDEFIEMIPFTETRSYVKNILRNYYYYRFYYGETNQ